jgi:hypothetical protein
MKKRRWFQIGVRLGLAVVAMIAFTGCAKLTIQCPPSVKAMDNNPTGRCLRWDPITGLCIKWG